MQVHFKKLEYHFLVVSTNIENATFPGKTVQSEANAKVNRMGSTKWTCHKGRSFASNYFIFFRKFCLSLRNSYKELIDVRTTQMSAIFILFERDGVLS